MKYGTFEVLDEGFAVNLEWFDDIRNVVSFLRVIALKKWTDKVLEDSL
jgi:hypothetical protein